MTTRSRIALVVAAVAAALAASGAAHACINVHIAPLGPDHAGPGDPVTFSIAGLLDGAQYTVSVDGHVIASGTSTGETVEGSFTMPDLGATSFATLLTAQVVHEDLEQSPWSTETAFTYDAPAPPTAEAPAPTVRAPSKPAATQPVRQARPQPVVHTVHFSAPAPVVTASAAAPQTTAPAPKVVTPAQRHHARPHVTPIGADTRAPLSAPRVLDRPASVPRVVVVGARPPQHTPWPLAALLIFLATLLPGAAYVVRGRKPRPEPPDEIELELQEMIAEERARTRERV